MDFIHTAMVLCRRSNLLKSIHRWENLYVSHIVLEVYAMQHFIFRLTTQAVVVV